MSIPSDHPNLNPKTIAEYAAAYRLLGLQIMPCQDKKAVLPWKEFQNDLIGQDVFDGLYGAAGRFVTRSDMGMCVITGKASGNIIMLDLDTYKPGGEAATNWLNSIVEVHNCGFELDTWEQVTGRGGRQLFFECPDGWMINNASTDLNIDLRGQGGYTVVPPTESYRWRPGRAPWEFELQVAPPWLCDEIERLIAEHGGGAVHTIPRPDQPIYAGPTKTIFGTAIIDGRERYMRDLIWANMRDLKVRGNPIRPGEREMMAVWPDYSRNVKVQNPLPGESHEDGLEREKRGITVFRQKWRHAVSKWDTEVAEAAKAWIEREPPTLAAFEQSAKQSEEQAKTTGKTLELLDVRQIKAMTDPEWMVEGIVIEQSLGFIYGPPGSLKTFIALDMALSFATGQAEWWTRKIARQGAVIYVSSEGHANLKFRIMAWETNHKVVADNAPFYLIRQSLNFMNGEDIGLLLATVEAAAAMAKCPVAAVFVDTVSRVLPGAEENQQKDMTIFVRACDQVRERFKAVVFGVHHTNKEGGFRGSTVMPGAGDFLIEVRRDTGAMVGSIYAKKVKDAEDGWEQQFKVDKIAVGAIGGKSSLVVNADDGKGAAVEDDGWPNKDILRKILAAVAEEWFNKRPWTHSKNSARYAVTNISKRWRIKREVVKDVLEEWMANGIVAHEVCDARNHISGYRKLTDI